MERKNYQDVIFEDVVVCGIPCEYYHDRINRESLPEGKYLYEVADGDCDGIPARIRNSVLCNFFGILVTDQKLLEEDTNVMFPNVKFLTEGDWDWQLPATSKAAEEEALEEIQYILDGLDKYCHVRKALDGCMEIAKNNLEEDAFFDPTESYEQAVEQAQELEKELESVKAELEAAKALVQSLQAKLGEIPVSR